MAERLAGQAAKGERRSEHLSRREVEALKYLTFICNPALFSELRHKRRQKY